MRAEIYNSNGEGIARQKTVLVVEDELHIATVLGDLIEALGHRFCGVARSAFQAIAAARDMQPDVILMDVRLQGDVDGVHAALVIGETTNSKIVFITGARDSATMERIQLAHPVAVLFKPFSADQLHKVIEETAGNPPS
jgi:CheY-like chemotaxis protein